MSKKYVPRFLKIQEESTLQSTGRSIVYSTNDKPLVNTSLPAKEAPSLTPATLASLTSNGENIPTIPHRPYNAYKPRSKTVNINLTSDNDFPSLGSVSKKENAEVAAKPSFATMAKEWAKKTKEEEEVKKKEDEKNALIEAERRKKEKEDRALFTSINANLSKLLHSKPQDDSELHKYEEDHTDEDTSISDEETYEEDEEKNEYVDDDAWNKRRNKYDMY